MSPYIILYNFNSNPVKIKDNINSFFIDILQYNTKNPNPTKTVNTNPTYIILINPNNIDSNDSIFMISSHSINIKSVLNEYPSLPRFSLNKLPK
jgi:hypothetical protein